MDFGKNRSILENIYSSQTNDIVLLYGSRYVGIRSVIFDFIKDKHHFYFKSKPCDFRLQMQFFLNDLNEKIKSDGISTNSASQLINEYSRITKNKIVIVIDDFTYLVKENHTFINYLLSITREECEMGNVMLLLCSEDIFYIDNSFESHVGKSAYEFKAVIKVNQLDFKEIRNNYKNIKFNDLISLYSVLGGNYSLWELYDTGHSVKDFICEEIINPKGKLYRYGMDILPGELRESSVYNTILYIIASGKNKLNDIHEITGYDRAKISVYLKNLIKRGLIYKAESVDAGADRYTKKGIYEITDPFISFWFKFIFPNISKTELLTPEKFYRKYIDQTFNLYREKAYLKSVISYLNSSEIIGNGIYFDFYLDKNEAIDFVGKDINGSIYIGASRFSSPHMAYSKFEDITNSAKSAGIIYEKIILVSAIDFDQKLHMYSSVHENLVLIDFK